MAPSFDAEARDGDHRRVAEAVTPTGTPLQTRRVGGLDAAYPDGDAVGAAVVLDAEAGDVVAAGLGRDPDPAPYVPGYLFARERPALEAALRDLGLEAARGVPWLVDGHGLLHPERAGLACHVGVALDLQTVGVGKSPLVADASGELAPGEAEALTVEGDLLGFALRPTAAARNPIYVSPGHRIGPQEALDLVRPLCIHRVPEPVRAADAQASEAAQGN